jgi:hypothetical protein
VNLHTCTLHATSGSEELSTMISKQILLVQNLKRKCQTIDVVTHDRMFKTEHFGFIQYGKSSPVRLF